MADPVTGMLVVAGAAEAGKAYFQNEAAGEKEKALELEGAQAKLQYQQKTLSNFDVMQKILDRQKAQASVRGVSLASPSLEATQRETINIGAKAQKNLEIEENLFERNVRIEKQNVRNTLYAQLFGDVTELGEMYARLK